MCGLCAGSDDHGRIARRAVLKLGAAGLAALAAAPHALAASAKAPPKPQNVLSPNDALTRLM